MKSLKMILLSLALLSGGITFASCKNVADREQNHSKESFDNPDKGRKRPDSFVIDKSGDTTLQAMIKDVVPKFKQGKYSVPGKETSIEYNLYTPENLDPAVKHPLVVFIADTSTAGKDVSVPLTQGYGGAGMGY